MQCDCLKNLWLTLRGILNPSTRADEILKYIYFKKYATCLLSPSMVAVQKARGTICPRARTVSGITVHLIYMKKK